MVTSAIKTLVEFCTRWPWTVIALSVLLAAGAGIYSAHHFAINTDINRLISPDLPWRKRELAFSAAFPQNKEVITAVIDAPTSEAASRAAQLLTDSLKDRKDLFQSVDGVSETPFFAREALLYLPTDQVASTATQLQQAAPLIQVLATDPTLRGLSQTLLFGLRSAQAGEGGLGPMAATLNQAAATLDAILAGKTAYFSWRELLAHAPPRESDLRRFVEIHPILDFTALEPGKKATDAIRRAAADLKLEQDLGATVRLTGSVPIADEEFATISEGALPNLLATAAVVLIILWLALRSARIIAAVFATVAIGLAITAAAGLMMVGALNPISVAFAVLFVGIGVDFGIQFSVRYRAERHAENDLRLALANAAEHISTPLALAAAATAAGFLSFVPTDYRGVSELGQIAGLGMIIAFLGSITVLPALLTIFNPRGESEPLGYAALAPVDRFMERYRMPILIGTVAVIVAALPLLYYLKFDFNPIDLRNPKAESIATYLDVRSDPSVGANAIDVLARSEGQAVEVAQRLSKLAEVSEVRTLANFVPPDQDRKIALIEGAARVLLPALNAPHRAAPTDQDNVGMLRQAQQALERAAGNRAGAGAAAAHRLAADLAQLAAASPELRARAQAVFVTPLQTALDGLRSAMHPQKVTDRSLPDRIRRQWLTPDGRARVEILPKGALNDNAEIRAFAQAVEKAEPLATGGPIAILESGRTIIRAFFEAGLWALISIAILLWLTLRRVGDVLLTLIPLLVAGVVTLELCVALGLALNFANIIALPLLLGIGVAFKIYYMMSWRAGHSQVLQSPLTRAVFFSALTTATAFGSLWFSNHPGTSSMGKLLALSLVCTLAAAVLFQPVLMGPPRNPRSNVTRGPRARSKRGRRTRKAQMALLE
ncbi:MAG TPA: MMPL family transporter [Pseudolabrys sp.]|nr:MMPL family transporter [Pseudolabrys sp.]